MQKSHEQNLQNLEHATYFIKLSRNPTIINNYSCLAMACDSTYYRVVIEIHLQTWNLTKHNMKQINCDLPKMYIGGKKTENQLLFIENIEKCMMEIQQSSGDKTVAMIGFKINTPAFKTYSMTTVILST